MPAPAVLIGLAVALTVATVVVVFTLTMLRDWIKARVGVYRNRKILAGAVRQRLATGNYKIVPFIFDEDLDKFVDAEAFEAQALDETLEQRFDNEDVMMFKSST